MRRAASASVGIAVVMAARSRGLVRSGGLRFALRDNIMLLETLVDARDKRGVFVTGVAPTPAEEASGRSAARQRRRPASFWRKKKAVS